MSLKLYRHQETAISFLEMNPEGLLIAYDVGTGKTFLCLEYLHRRLKRGEIHNALIICPASLVGTWERAIDDCVMFEGFTPDDVSVLKKAITITSYQRTYCTIKRTLHKRDGTAYELSDKHIREDIDKMWDVIVCDESHNLGGHSSVQTKVCIKLATHAKCRIAMSGTPLHGGRGMQAWEKMYGQLQFITASTRWKNWTDFTKQYVLSVDKWYKPDLWDNDKCQKAFQEYTIACRREDCVDLPGYTENDIICELVEKKVYNDIAKGNLDKYHITCDTAGSQYGKLLQVVSGSCKTDDGTMTLKSSKHDALKDILLSTNEKIVIFCRYTASIDQCMAIANKIDKNCIAYDGRSKGETWRQFQDGSSDVLVIQYDSGSAGLNLQSAHICVFYEPTLSALKLEQAKGRIYRSGQREKCTYYYLTTKDTIEDKVWRMVRSGVTINNSMLEQLAKGEL